jgi:hypothetical protein
MSIPSCRFRPDCATATCPMEYAAMYSNPSTHATFAISGTTMIVNAT